MSRRTHPRPHLLALAVLAAAAATVTSACSDATGAGPRGPAIVFSGHMPVVRPPNDVGSGPPDELYAVAPAGGGTPRQITHAGGAWEPTWSADGRRIAFTKYGVGSGGPRGAALFVVGADGSGLHQLPLPAGDSYAPAWAPSGGRIAFIRDDLSVFGIAVTEVGSDTFHLVAPYPTVYPLGSRPSWSPDGARLVFSSYPGNGVHELWVVGADGTGLHKIADAGSCDAQPAWSPDGHTLAYVECDASGSRIATMLADGTGRAALTAGPEDEVPVWSPDGRSIAFARGPGNNGPTHIYRMDVAAGGASAVDLTPAMESVFWPSWRR